MKNAKQLQKKSRQLITQQLYPPTNLKNVWQPLGQVK